MKTEARFLMDNKRGRGFVYEAETWVVVNPRYSIKRCGQRPGSLGPNSGSIEMASSEGTRVVGKGPAKAVAERCR